MKDNEQAACTPVFTLDVNDVNIIVLEYHHWPCFCWFLQRKNAFRVIREAFEGYCTAAGHCFAAVSLRNRSREAEKPQYQHTQQKCFPQSAAHRLFIWPHSEDKVRMRFQFGVCNRGWVELLVRRKTHSISMCMYTPTEKRIFHWSMIHLCSSNSICVSTIL